MLSIIAAMSEDRVIGRNGRLPWHLPADLKHFKELTMGHAIIMGRKTFESIGKALPGRTSIVLSHHKSLDAPGVLTARNLEEAVELAPGDAEVFVIGGAEVFDAAMPIGDRLYLTLVHTTVPDGDVQFPQFNEHDWKLVDERHVPADENNAHAMSFRMYEKMRNGK